MKSIFNFILLFSLLGISSCNSWLDIQPSTSIQEKKLFESEAGFKDALTGFYIKMGSSNLYARELTYNYMDMLAQLYDEAPDMLDWATVYNYNGSVYQGTINTFFSEMYNNIANINNFLYYLEVNKNVLKTPHYYEIMKGEALGLRAFLHFDLLRMFGPVYQVNPQGPSIPYRLKFDQTPVPVLPADKVIEKILVDLHQADSLLQTTDPKVFRIAGNIEDPFLAFRQLRMNTYAVKALLARIYCYKGDAESKKMALGYARQVIDGGRFSLSEKNSSGNRILFQEHIFSLHVYELNTVIIADFDRDAYAQMLSISVETRDFLFDKNTGGSTDFRNNNISFKEIKDPVGKVKVVLSKYDQSGYPDRYSGAEIVPLIRIPEMYYIMAECDPSSVNSAGYINTVRFSRSIATSDAIDGTSQAYDQIDIRPDYANGQTMRTNELMREYRKEYYGEGQLFYFYKRNNYTTFYHCPLRDIRSKYQFPLPDNEIIFGAK